MYEPQEHELLVIPLVIALVGGFFWIAWGWRMWQHPSKLRPDSPMYQFILTRYYSRPYHSYGEPQRLTEKQVKSYAVFVMLGGIFPILVAIAFFLAYL